MILAPISCKEVSAPTPTRPQRTPITPIFVEAPKIKPLDAPKGTTLRDDPTSPPQRPDADAVREDRTAILELLEKGRAQVKRGEYDAAIGSYQEALLIDPNHARLLSELGWAAFKGKQFELAEQATRLSVRHANSPSIKGASLYNLGRIAEARTQPKLAASHYRASLEARPHNTTVIARLDRLIARGITPIQGEKCDFERHNGELAHSLSAFELCQHFTEHAPDMCSSTQPSTPALKIGDFTVRTFSTEPEEDNGHTRFLYVAVLGPKTWYSSLTGIEYNPGVGYIHDTLDLPKIRTRSLLPDTELPQVILTIDHDYTDGDYPRNEAVFIDIKLEAMLDLNGRAPRWVASVLAHHSEASDKMIDEEDGIDHGKDFPRTQSAHYSISWSEQGYTTTLDKGQAYPDNPAGTYTYARPLMRCPASHDFLL